MNVAIIGASGGIGSALACHYNAQDSVDHIYAFSRSACSVQGAKIKRVSMDITDEDSIKDAAALCDLPLDIVIVASGMLHSAGRMPEKSLKDIDYDFMQESFAINTIGPALIIKHFLPLLDKDKRGVLAILSARLGSISDNQIGGWYSYRASKAALNMMIKTASIEAKRTHRQAILLGLHPGTVDTKLSENFRSNIKHEIFTPGKSAQLLCDLIDNAALEDSGKCLAWDGQEVLP
jgi:NAD(P)-dependent dehydrogenase (short-subunit alcohol dehydrogenase family)